MKKDYKNLLAHAKMARRNSYSPYSGMKVGAAVLTKGGRIYTGTNVENASFGLTVCAERAAILNAVNKGEKDFAAIAVSCGAQDPAVPCGACRQVIFEFGPNIDVVMEKSHGKFKVEKISKLLPLAFKLKILEG